MGFLDSLFFGFEFLGESLEKSGSEEKNEPIETEGEDIPSQKKEKTDE